MLRPIRYFATIYFDEIFVHIRVEDNLSDVQIHLRHLKQVFKVMRQQVVCEPQEMCLLCIDFFGAGLLRK